MPNGPWYHAPALGQPRGPAAQCCATGSLTGTGGSLSAPISVLAQINRVRQLPKAAANRARMIAAVWSGGAAQTAALKISTST